MIKILIGFISGIVSGIGMGGGTILILCLSIFLKIEQHMAQAANLAFFIPTAIAAIIVNIKYKNVNIMTGWPIIITGCIGAVIGTKISQKLNVEILKKFFGFFLAIIATHEIYVILKEYKQIKKTNNRLRD